MNESILESIKHLIGFEADYEAFDQDLIIHINSVFFTLKQLGAHDAPFKITGPSETWSDYLGENEDLELIKSYVYMKTRMLFDPPTSGTLMEAMKEQIREAEFRINVEVDPKKE